LSPPLLVSPSISVSPSNAITRLVEIDSSPIGRTPRSSAATYTGIWNDIRRVFARTKQARQRGYGASRFSFNAKGGRCEECRGAGVKRIAMSFLPDLEVTCPACHGLRFNRQTLALRYRDKNIADVLTMSADEAAEFFANHETIHRVLTTLADVGLGYLTLGQPATTLSGGEAQRIKLAAELAQSAADGHTLYLLDEPTTGLATDDIRRLLGVLHRLVDQGNSMIVIEHNLDVIKTADWIIDLGPEGGAAGGRIVVEGPPETIAACLESHTGRFLRRVLDRQH
jgi:excinuclease ABC subunit A